MRGEIVTARRGRAAHFATGQGPFLMAWRSSPRATAWHKERTVERHSSKAMYALARSVNGSGEEGVKKEGDMTRKGKRRKGIHGYWESCWCAVCDGQHA